MMKKVLVLFVFVFLLMPMFVFGQREVTCSDASGSSLPPCSSVGFVGTVGEVGTKPSEGSSVSMGSIVPVVMQLVNWFAWFVGVMAVVMGLYSGFLFITARDNANKLETARKTMMWAIIGIAVAILSFSLVKISSSIFGISGI